MTALDVFEHYSRLEAKCAELESKLSQYTDVSRFSEVAISTSEAGRLLGIDRKSVLDYANRGLLKRHPCSTDEKVMLVASDVLMKTGKGLKEAKRQMKWNLKAVKIRQREQLTGDARISGNQ